MKDSKSRFTRIYTTKEQELFADIKLKIEARLKKMSQTKEWLALKMGISKSRLSMLLGNQSRGEIWNILELTKLKEILGVSILIPNTGVFELVA